jgi:hypothetical protein
VLGCTLTLTLCYGVARRLRNGRLLPDWLVSLHDAGNTGDLSSKGTRTGSTGGLGYPQGGSSLAGAGSSANAVVGSLPARCVLRRQGRGWGAGRPRRRARDRTRHCNAL